MYANMMGEPRPRLEQILKSQRKIKLSQNRESCSGPLWTRRHSKSCAAIPRPESLENLTHILKCSSIFAYKCQISWVHSAACYDVSALEMWTSEDPGPWNGRTRLLYLDVFWETRPEMFLLTRHREEKWHDDLLMQQICGVDIRGITTL